MLIYNNAKDKKGKKTMTARQKSIKSKKGMVAFMTSTTGRLKTVDDTNRLMPKGGVR